MAQKKGRDLSIAALPPAFSPSGPAGVFESTYSSFTALSEGGGEGACGACGGA